MAPIYFQKPEAALKRADELIHVGKQEDALEMLHETIKARRHRQWSSTHEDIMMKHLTLCVNLRKPHMAKDALFQYKALTQQVAINSLEKVINFFLDQAEQRTEEAQKMSIEKVEEIDDLDQGDNPESLLLSVVSGAATQDRMDRTVLAPWLRFLWDSYRNCLELLRNNSQVEQLYHRITRQSLTFCTKYQRRTEFRKLCELLRLHLNQIQKHQHLAHVVKLSSPESLNLMQETRLCQLDTAIQMELWQEAYRSAEDVHGMMQMSKDKDRRLVKASSYVNYYDKLALVFWKAGNRLFHAAALLQKFIIYKDMKKSFTPDEALDQATRVLLATLSIPDGADAPTDLTRHLDMEDHHHANIRLLSNLLRLPITPTRASLLKECARLSIPETASAEARQLYKLLENNFAPLKLATLTESELVKIEKPEYSQYVESLRVVVATKAIKQTSVIYDVISWDRIKKVIPFFDDIQLEQFLVDSSKHRFVKANIDHRENCVRFGGAAEATLAGGVDLEEADGFTGDDTQLGVEGIRAHLELMYNKLRDMVEVMDGEKKKKELVERVHTQAQVYLFHKASDYERILARRKKIENYKETSERTKEQKNAQALAEQQKRDEIKRQEEMKRLEQEHLEIEKKRRLAEQEELQRKVRSDQLKKMQATPIYQNILKDMDEKTLEELDPEALLLEQRQRLDRERKEQQQRLQEQEKKFDHMVRAFHLEEMMERRQMMGLRMSEAPKLHKEYEERRVQKEIEEHELQVKKWEWMQAIHEDAVEWIASVKESHAAEFEQKLEDFVNKVKNVRNSRLQDRSAQRKVERRKEWLAKKADEERRQKEEEERQKQMVIEMQKKEGRGIRDDRRDRDHYQDSSAAMQDSDWRGGAKPIGGGALKGYDRAPMRERPTMDREPRRAMDMAPSAADTDSSWRSGTRPIATPAQPTRIAAAPERERDGGAGAYRPGAFAARRPEPAETGAWTRGNVIKIEHKPAPEPVAAPAPAPAKPGAYVPPRLRNAQMNSQQQPDSDGWSAVPGKRSDRAAALQGPRGPAPPPERERRPFGAGRPANPDNDTNWRK